MVDIDETSNSPASFMIKYGWSPVGDECLVSQIRIGGHSYSTIAAVTPRGFLFWEIYLTPVTGVIFSSFLQNLHFMLMPEQFGLLDNAVIHHTAEARDALDECFGGRYVFCAKYSPHLKPIEPCFALVKTWIRQREEAAVRDPIRYINEAFEYYSIGHQGAASVRGHWKIYFSLHALYIDGP